MSKAKTSSFVSRLKQIAFFKAFNPRELSCLSAHLQEKRLSGQSLVFQEGDKGRAFYWIEKGKVLIYKDIERLGLQPLALLRDGDFFGEMNLLISPVRFACAKALEDTLLVVCKDTALQQLLKNDKALGLNMLKQLFVDCSAQLKTTTENLCDLIAFVHGATGAKTQEELKGVLVDTLKKILSPTSCKGGALFSFNKTLSEYTPQAHWGGVSTDFLVSKNDLIFPPDEASLVSLGANGGAGHLLIVGPRDSIINRKIPLLETLGKVFEKIGLRLENTTT